MPKKFFENFTTELVFRPEIMDFKVRKNTITGIQRIGAVNKEKRE